MRVVPIGMTPASESSLLALALGGGGARAAYQVGFLRTLARRIPELQIPIVTGVSAGAINAVHLAGHSGSFPEAVETLAVLWDQIDTGKVFRTDARSIGGLVFQWALRLGLGGARRAPKPRGLVDTTPLREFLSQAFNTRSGSLDGIAKNIAAGRMHAVAITTTNLGTGRSTTWVAGTNVQGWSRSTRVGIPATLTLDHVMASSAVPLFFPAVRLGDAWHGDGGIRQLAPLSPALKLGANRILAISTRHSSGPEDVEPTENRSYPPPAQVLGLILSAAFFDTLDHDALNMRRISELAEKLPAEDRGGLHPAKVMLLRPSRDLGAIARDYESHLPRAFRFVMRGLGTRDSRSLDLLSMLMFVPEFLDAIMDLGERDAETQAEAIAAFVAGR